MAFLDRVYEFFKFFDTCIDIHRSISLCLQSNDALKSPASADNSAENGTTALVKEVRFRLSQYKLDEINTCEESHI